MLHPQTPLEFARELIKGRIAETVFEQMIKHEERFMVIPFGYEHTMPLLAQHQHHVQLKKVMNNIKDAPDFALVSKDNSQVYLVEVKYRSAPNKDGMTQLAMRLLKRWDPSWLFIATPQQFFCTTAHTIVNNHGHMDDLNESWVNLNTQNEYLKLLGEFEKL
ncbi:MAG TPA: hypothetical protein PKG71_02520 [Candidatus Woesebacteria bacterium]|nr:hypothetical protein [Candidatus Woesebacteria bacterium]HNS94819.1 hypothetical protein [Candidatus Woesebacteria bacterium]